MNPRQDAVQGRSAYPRVSAIPQVPDLAVVCMPAATVPGLVRECGEGASAA